MMEIKRDIYVPQGSALGGGDYRDFLEQAYNVMSRCGQYFAPEEDINALELAHLIPEIPETVLAIYLGINDAVCNKGLVSPFLLRHGHNNVFVFDSQVYPGSKGVPSGTIDAQKVLNGFQPPNKTWNKAWTYVMIEDPARTSQSLWKENGYIDMIPAKFEDFTALTAASDSMVCTWIDAHAFEHPVNKARGYLDDARKRGANLSAQFGIPKGLETEVDGLVPVILDKAEKLYVARTDFGPCAHAWSNIHPQNNNWAVVNENSAVPLDLVTAKPPVNPKYAKGLVPPRGSADMTTDWFYRGTRVMRCPLLTGTVKG